MQNDQNKQFLVILMVFAFCKLQKTSRKSRMQIMTSGANQNLGQKSKSVRNFEKIVFFRCISQYFVVFSMFTWLTMHGNDFKHHFRRLYIIFNHIESYTKLPKSYSKVIFSVKCKVPEHFLLTFVKHEVFRLFQ